jgi:Rrf2 family protein
MFSRSAEYAVRALSFLAQSQEGICLQSKEIADELGLPPQFLTKILRKLTPTGIVASQRGRTGGFRLTRPPEEISVLSIIEPFEATMDDFGCLLGQGACVDHEECPLHEPWLEIHRSIHELLEGTTLAEVAQRAIRTNATRPEFPGDLA